MAWLLDLGEVRESARVKLNGQLFTTLIGPKYQVIIDQASLQEQNQLEIEVSNLMANRIAFLDKSGTPWKKFYNINISARKRENLGPLGIFDASNWEPRPSGLLGPVSMAPIKP